MNSPYYAVIFTSWLAPETNGYPEMARQMEELAAQQKGFLGVQSARGDDGFGITVSYWQTLADVAAWKSHLSHQEAQHAGRTSWYAGYQVRVCKVEREYEFEAAGPRL